MTTQPPSSSPTTIRAQRPRATVRTNSGSKQSPNYEAPLTANGDNFYKVTIIATDSKGLTGEKELTIEVINIDEVGTVKLSRIQPGIGQEITATLTDPDMGVTGEKWQWWRSDTRTGTFEEIDGATSSSYTPIMSVKDNADTTNINETVTGDEGMYLRATVTYRDDQSADDNPDTDHEEGRRGDLRGDDGSDEGSVHTPVEGTPHGDDQVGKTSDNAVRVVPGVNNPPAFASATMTRMIEENSPAGTPVEGDPVMAADSDGDVLDYVVTGGADMGAFELDDDDQIAVKDGTKLDYELGTRSYVIEITASDPFGGSDVVTVTIMVTDKNEKPDLMLASAQQEDPPCTVNASTDAVSCNFDENGTDAVADFSAMDPEEEGIGWTVDGPDRSLFDITGGVLTFKTSPNFENPADKAWDVNEDNRIDEREGAGNNNYQVTVRATEMLAEGQEPPAAVQRFGHHCDGQGRGRGRDGGHHPSAARGGADHSVECDIQRSRCRPGPGHPGGSWQSDLPVVRSQSLEAGD